MDRHLLRFNFLGFGRFPPAATRIRRTILRNGQPISLVTTTTLETILAATTLFVLRLRRAGSGALRLVFGILLCWLIPVVFTIAMG